MAFNVLIVDDSSSMRAVIKKTIRVSGFNVGEYWAAGDGIEALETLRNEWIDVVLTDINMPNMNGLELVSAMKEDSLLKSIPVVMVTTEGSEKRMKEAMALGAKGYIKKPFMPKEIKDVLSSIMGETDNAQSDNDNEYEESDF